MKSAALQYAAEGVRVFPCVPGEKVPAVQAWQDQATTDEAKIEEWWSRWPDANIGMPTTGLLIVDADGRDNDWLTDRPELWGDIANAPLVRTPSGGRHYYFRQPAGRSWRNTAKKLHPKVDTRADGGYVLVPPSVVNGARYQWITELDDLAEPPRWLVEQLEAAVPAAPLAEVEAFAAGSRNDTLVRYAGFLRRGGLSAEEIAAALLAINARRAKPPLPDAEIWSIAVSAARYEPDQITEATLAGDANRLSHVMMPAWSVADAVQCEDYDPPIIHQLLRRGEVMNLVAPPKLGKTFLVMGLALTAATGQAWLDMFQCERSRVLLVDNECQPRTIQMRLQKIAAEMGLPSLDIVRDWCAVKNIRPGPRLDLHHLGPFFDQFRPGDWDLIIFDALYKMLPKGLDENSNADVADIYGHLDELTARLQCGLVLVHHTSKGLQGEKSVTDVGSGAGAQSRAADTHMVLRHHQQQGAAVVDGVVRSWPPWEAFAISRAPGGVLWRADATLDPADLFSGRRKRDVDAAASPAPAVDQMGIVLSAVGDGDVSRASLVERVRAAGLTMRQAAAVIDSALDSGLLRAGRGRGNGLRFFRSDNTRT